MMAKNLNQASQRKIHDDYHLHGTDSLSVYFCLFVCFWSTKQEQKYYFLYLRKHQALWALTMLHTFEIKRKTLPYQNKPFGKPILFKFKVLRTKLAYFTISSLIYLPALQKKPNICLTINLLQISWVLVWILIFLSGSLCLAENSSNHFQATCFLNRF